MGKVEMDQIGFTFTFLRMVVLSKIPTPLLRYKKTVAPDWPKQTAYFASVNEPFEAIRTVSGRMIDTI